eukprot:COSAG01_NODE_1911_length_8925_cov_151.747111_7_plen_55_part_00
MITQLTGAPARRTAQTLPSEIRRHDLRQGGLDAQLGDPERLCVLTQAVAHLNIS